MAVDGSGASADQLGQDQKQQEQPLANSRPAPGVSDKPPTVRAWDLPTRVFHWMLVALVINAYLTNKFGGDELFWHRLNGYGVLTLVLFRIFWGLIGGSTSRFGAFVRWPWRAASYVAGFVNGQSKQYLGHNPLGGWAVLLLLALFAFQGVSGLFSNDDVLAEGPLVGLVSYDTSAYISKLHLLNFDLLLVVIGLHIAANLGYLFWKKINLIKPMITGVKAAEQFEDMQEARFGSPFAAFLCLFAAATLVLGTVKLLGGSLL